MTWTQSIRHRYSKHMYSKWLPCNEGRASTGLTLLFLALAVAIAGGEKQVSGQIEKSLEIRPPSSYVLGVGDQISILALDAPEVSDKPIFIDTDGYMALPLVGRLRVAGRTVRDLEDEIATRLRKYVKEPQVAVIVTAFGSQPVSLIGSVRSPGVHQLQGRKTLVEVLSLAGGLAPDAGYSVRIARRKEWGRLPLAGTTEDPTGQFSVAQVSIKDILEATNPAENIEIRPYDVISVPRGEMIYVMGEVRRPGGFVLGDQEKISILKVLSLAEGLQPLAAPQHARILRTRVGVSDKRMEIPVDLKGILTGKAMDVPLQADDILFVPTNGPKKAVIRAIETALGIGTSAATGLIIYR